jgi:hypothetical protein
LEDTTLNPLWDDATLNEALAGAVRAYGLRIPKQAVTTIVIAAGATEVEVPAVTGDPSRFVRVIDPRGHIVPAAAGDPASGLVAQSWRWWDGTLRLSHPALGGTWRLEHLAPRQAPTADAGEVAIEAGDEELVLALATVAVLRHRATADAKRGARTELRALLDTARSEVAQLFAARQRRVRGGWLGDG